MPSKQKSKSKSKNKTTNKKTSAQCEEVKKGPWTIDENQLLLQAVKECGKNWKQVASRVPGRKAKQCRQRYVNHLNPEIVKRPWSVEEDLVLCESIRQFGTSWKHIANTRFHGRTANDIKNRWNGHLKRKLDPVIVQDIESFISLEQDTRKRKSSEMEVSTEEKDTKLESRNAQKGRFGYYVWLPMRFYKLALCKFKATPVLNCQFPRDYDSLIEPSPENLKEIHPATRLQSTATLTLSSPVMLSPISTSPWTLSPSDEHVS